MLQKLRLDKRWIKESLAGSVDVFFLLGKLGRA